jgi:hypothetical protein
MLPGAGSEGKKYRRHDSQQPSADFPATRADAAGGAASAACASNAVRLHKLIMTAVEEALEMLPVKPGQGFALDAAARVAQTFGEEMNQLVLGRNCSDHIPTAAERFLQRQSATLAQTLDALTQEEKQWSDILADAKAEPTADETAAFTPAEPASDAESQVDTLPRAMKAAAESITLQVSHACGCLSSAARSAARRASSNWLRGRCSAASAALSW